MAIPHLHFPMFAFNIKTFRFPMNKSNFLSSKTGNKLLKNTFTWVCHGVVTKVVMPTGAKKNHDGPDEQSPLFEIDIALTNVDSEIPSVILDEKIKSECIIELISKQYPDSAMEYALRILQMESDKVSTLCKSIILGEKIEKSTINEQHYLYINQLIEKCVGKKVYRIQRPNTKQMHALETALTTTFSLIQGPPGTGKTVTGIILGTLLCSNE